MTDSTEAGGQEPNADAGQNPTPSNESGGNEQDSKPTGFDALPEETKTEIRNLRREAAKYRKQVDDFENANKTESQRQQDALKAAEERATKAETRLRDANARSVVSDAAGKVNAISVRAVYALIRSDLEFDDDGEPTNVAALIKQAQKDEPQLFKAAAGSGDGGARSPTGSDNDINSIFRQAMRRG